MAYRGPLEDRLAIRELIETYNDAVFRRDGEAWISTWAEDAVWELMGQTIEGRADIRAAWQQAMEMFDYVGFHGLPGAIEIEDEGQRATARVYVNEVMLAKDGGYRNVQGGYDDTLVKTDGQWLFARRVYRVMQAKNWD